MGQQQLILLVLATVIVGVAIVVGVSAFDDSEARANADAMMQDAVRIASDAQAAVKKPAAIGGVADLNSVGLNEIGYSLTGGSYSNLNGDYEKSNSGSGLIITGSDESGNQEVQVAVCGLSSDNITGVITQVGGQSAGTAPTC